MDTEESIRTIVGICFIVYGLGVTAYEQFHEMKYIDQINGVLNGFACVVAGVIACAYNVQQGILVGVIALVVWIIEKIILIKIYNKKVKNE